MTEDKQKEENILKCPVCSQKMKAANNELREGKPVWFYCQTANGFEGGIYPSVYGACPLKWKCLTREDIETGQWIKFLPKDIDEAMRREIGYRV